MKKIFCAFLLTICCAMLFAEQQVSLTFKPYTFQALTDNEYDKAQSDYGIGGGLGYEISLFGTGFRAGADLYADTYFFDEKKNLVDLTFMGKAGYGFLLDENTSRFAFLKYGLDIQLFNKKHSTVQVFGIEVGGSHKISKKLALSATVEGLFAFAKKGGDKYANYRVNTVLGMSYVL